MQKLLFFMGLILIPSIALADDVSTLANQALLPENFSLYTDGQTASNQPGDNLIKKTLPTVNFFTGSPGCYVACYSDKNTPAAVYAASDDVFVYGQVRVPGVYLDRICIPSGYINKDISKELTFTNLCRTSIPACQKNECWAGGDTGGWFGLPY